MSSRAKPLILAGALALAAGCEAGAGPGQQGGGAWENLAPVPNTNADAAPQPLRQNPFAVAMTADGATGFVTLRGSELEPGSEVAVIDIAARSVATRLDVGSSPHALRITPDGELAVVLSRFSPLAAVINVRDRRVSGKIRVGYYASSVVFSADGSGMYVTNRAANTVQLWDVSRVGSTLAGTLVKESPAGNSPGSVALSPDGTKVYVADTGGLGVRVFRAGTLDEITFIRLNAPMFDIEPMGPWMVVSTLNDTNGLPCEDDGDYVGTQGDGVFPIVTDRTCSRGFADIQNEIAFIDPVTDEVAIRYTSDSAEVSEADREGDHDPELMQVVGALPQGIGVVRPTRAYVAMSASDQLVEMSLDGASPPRMAMARTWTTGMAPQDVAVDSEGSVALVANKLGETATIVELVSGDVFEVAIGNVSQPFPATDAELGEWFFHSAQYSSDGDQSCMHCHADAGDDGKTWGVGVVRAFGRRATLPLRNLFETKPLLVEGVFDETDFTLEMEAMSFRPDFHDSSYALQVQRRNAFYREVSLELMHRELDFDDIARYLAEYLMIEPRLLPSPFPKDSPEVERGEALFMRPDVGCAACHPPPTFASDENFQGVTTPALYDRPSRTLDPNNSIKFLEQARDGFFNANSLRGLWSRRGAMFHDGRARTIRETLMTPSHPCLAEGERPFNEFNGQIDTNGGISHLTCDQIDDLEAFLLSLE